MQVDRQHAIDARARDHVGDELRRDRHARRARPPVLARVAEVRHHRGDARRRRAPAGIDHDQQLHQVVVGRRARRLHDEHVAAAHVLHHLDVHLAVGEPSDVGAPSGVCQVTRDVVRQLPDWHCPRTAPAFLRPPPIAPYSSGQVVATCPTTGWGGRIRTSEWRDQNPLPYHLATPQRPNSSSSGPALPVKENYPARVRRTRATYPEPAPRRAPRPRDAQISRTRRSPVPVSRAGACRASQSNASATAGKRARTTASQSFRPPVSKKPRIVVGGEFRVNSAAWNTAAVGTATPGNMTRYQESAPSETGVSLSPIPSAQADRPATKTGTSAPNLTPIAAICAEVAQSPHLHSGPPASWLRPSCRRPARRPSGMRFLMEISAPKRGAGLTCCSARAARTARSSDFRHARSDLGPDDGAVVPNA